MVECGICCANVNKRNPCITCAYCNESGCKTCTEKYLTETFENPHCMYCRKEWNTAFLITTFSITFINGKLKKHRENVVVDRQKAMLPSSTDDVHIEVNRRQTIASIREVKNRTRQLKYELDQAKDTLLDLELSIHRGTYKQIEKCHPSSYKCPANQCRGFLSDWKCGVCDTNVCDKCLDIKHEGHVCSPDSVETMRLLKRDTKLCPGCGEGVMKIDGCDQMWCTSCHTTFSWRTGMRTHEKVHNPHYYEFLRANGTLRRDPLDIECGGMPDAYMIRQSMNKNVLVFYRDKVCKMIQNLNHNAMIHSRHYPTMFDTALYDTSLRVKYLLNEISENDWKSKLHKNEKKLSRLKEFGDVITMVDQTSADIMRKIARDIKHPQAHELNEVSEGIDLLNELREYANANLQRIGIAFKCKYPGYKHDFEWIKHV